MAIWYILLRGLYAIRWFYKNRKRLRKDTKNWLVDVFAAVAIIYGAFHLFWGLNYHRLPLHKSLNLARDYTTEQLVHVTKALIKKSNTLHFEITKNDTIKADIPFSKGDIFKMVPTGYTNLKREFSAFGIHPEKLKKIALQLSFNLHGF